MAARTFLHSRTFFLSEPLGEVHALKVWHFPYLFMMKLRQSSSCLAVGFWCFVQYFIFYEGRVDVSISWMLLEVFMTFCLHFSSEKSLATLWILTINQSPRGFDLNHIMQVLT
jgi:hypothetical protein